MRNSQQLAQQHQAGGASAGPSQPLSASQPAAQQGGSGAGGDAVLRVENLRLKYALAAQVHSANHDTTKATACEEVRRGL